MNPSKPGIATWMGGAFIVSAALAIAALTFRGPGHAGTVTGLQLTARWAYGFFWLAYSGGPLTVLFGPRFRPLARRGRELGLAFASAMSLHAGLVVWIYHVSARPPLPLSAAIYFGIGLAFAYTLALFSIPSLAAKLPPRLWRIFLIVGMEYIALAFLRDFLHDPFGHGPARLLGYLPFLVLALTGALLRATAYVKRFHKFIGTSRHASETARSQP